MVDVDEIFGGDDFDIGDNVQIDDLDSERQTAFALYIDCSGTMGKYESIMPGCIQVVKDSIITSESEDEFLISLTLFNHSVKRAGYKKVNDIDTAYSTCGGTAIYDAIVGAQLSLVNEEENGYVDTLKKGDVTTKGIFVIMTDGKDQHSNLKVSDAKKSVKYMNEKEVITVYIGFGEDACGVGQKLGFKYVMDVKDANVKSLHRIFDIVSKSAVSANKGGNASGSIFTI